MMLQESQELGVKAQSHVWDLSIWNRSRGKHKADHESRENIWWWSNRACPWKVSFEAEVPPKGEGCLNSQPFHVAGSESSPAQGQLPKMSIK